VAAGDFEGAGEVARHARRTWAQGEEYEEDFLFVELLMQHFFLGADRARCEAMLVRYERALQGATQDLRLDICKALLEPDAQSFGEALGRFLSERHDRLARQVKEESLAPELAATEALLCVEGLALVGLAERKGLETDEDYLQVPSIARGPFPVGVAGDSWMRLDEEEDF